MASAEIKFIIIIIIIIIKAKFCVYVLSETCLLSDENHPILEGYSSYVVRRSCNRSNRGGGLLVYVPDKLLH